MIEEICCHFGFRKVGAGGSAGKKGNSSLSLTPPPSDTSSSLPKPTGSEFLIHANAHPIKMHWLNHSPKYTCIAS